MGGNVLMILYHFKNALKRTCHEPFDRKSLDVLNLIRCSLINIIDLTFWYIEFQHFRLCCNIVLEIRRKNVYHPYSQNSKIVCFFLQSWLFIGNRLFILLISKTYMNTICMIFPSCIFIRSSSKHCPMCAAQSKF